MLSQYRRTCRHLFHENYGKVPFVVVSNWPYQKKNRKYMVIQKDVYSSHSSIKEKYPFIVCLYE